MLASTVDTTTLSEWVEDAYARLLVMVADLTDQQLFVPHLETVNPFLWELGHVAWFQEKWMLRHLRGASPIESNADRLFDSIAILHDNRWDLSLPCREEILTYAEEVKRRVLQLLDAGENCEELLYFAKLTTFHADMHAEAFTYMRQTLGYPYPCQLADRPARACEGSLPSQPIGDEVTIPGGTIRLGADPLDSFVFDNEKWAHPRMVEPFTMSVTPVTETEYAAFVNDEGYRRPEFWDPAGWSWRLQGSVEQPMYWSNDGPDRWLRRSFDQLVPVNSGQPMTHVNWFEARAWCRWAGRRLPTEAEWELAAAYAPDPDTHSLASDKRRYPWGDESPTDQRANLDWLAHGPVDVAAFPDGASGFGVSQLIGNVWEWTDCEFAPYPGFRPDWYREYSEPWFHTHKVLRGGSWATRSRLIRNGYRNFFLPERRDIFAGFRTCAV